MTREEYVIYRNAGNGILLWEYYNEKYKGNNKLTMDQFIEAMSHFPFNQQAYQDVVNEWDIKFNIMTITNKFTNEVIRYY